MTVSSPGLWQRKWLKVTSSTLFKAPCTRLQLGCHTAGCPSLVRGLVAHMLPACKLLKNPAIFLPFLPFNHVNSFGGGQQHLGDLKSVSAKTKDWQVKDSEGPYSKVLMLREPCTAWQFEQVGWPAQRGPLTSLEHRLTDSAISHKISEGLIMSDGLAAIQLLIDNNTETMQKPPCKAQTCSNNENQSDIFPFQSQFQYREACLARQLQSVFALLTSFDLYISIPMLLVGLRCRKSGFAFRIDAS